MVAGARLVFIVAGLGGGTGSGAAPVLARLAREAGALTLGVAALPFDCEGRLRAAHAREALTTFRSSADAVICVPKQRVLAQYKDHERPALVDVLEAANQLAGQSIVGLIKLLTRPGLMPLDFAHLERLLRGRHAESCFAAVETVGSNRTQEAVELLLRHPFLDRGQALMEAHAVLLSITAGPEVTFTEIDRVFTRLQNACEHAAVITGTSIDSGVEGRLIVTVIATRNAPPAAGTALPAIGAQGTSEGATGYSPISGDPSSAPTIGAAEGLAFTGAIGQRGSGELGSTPGAEGVRTSPLTLYGSHTGGGGGAAGGGTGQPVAGVSGLFGFPGEGGGAKPGAGASGGGGTGPGNGLGVNLAGKKKGKPVQSLLNFTTPVGRGRFEGIPATIYQGENLDIPTYARRGIALN
jgi:cell division protein FtsZ